MIPAGARSRAMLQPVTPMATATGRAAIVTDLDIRAAVQPCPSSERGTGIAQLKRTSTPLPKPIYLSDVSTPP
ncbi:hypothetical protein NPX13_g1030 [Xylaria arbuscula]|uniref:Uncharacterized protein n=1 Tax=Xylaria arbuscula TaxID=114810 RepID=A0A9W8NMF4_9PEZI|nr:hypothetical protein NPX13_g1030 [Xylaria arbuscula]